MAPSADIHDPSSSAYKKAKRQYIKATRARDHNIELDWTPFRAAEKRYKARFPPPDLSSVLDLATLDPCRVDEISRGGWTGRVDTVRYRDITGRDGSSAKAYAIPSIPGAIHFFFLRIGIRLFTLR